MPLERILVVSTGKDLQAFRPRLTKAAALADAPPAVRERADALLAMVEPLIERTTRPGRGQPSPRSEAGSP